MPPCVPPLALATGNGNANVHLAGGSLAGPLDLTAMLDAQNHLTLSDSRKFSFRLSIETGIFTGAIKDIATGKMLLYNGALLQKQVGGFGQVLTPGGRGCWKLGAP